MSRTATIRPTLAAAEDEAPSHHASTTDSSGANDALTIGQVVASAVRISGHAGRRPASSCSPRSSAYSSATQYTRSVTRVETTSGRVGRREPMAARTAAVIIVAVDPGGCRLPPDRADDPGRSLAVFCAIGLL